MKIIQSRYMNLKGLISYGGKSTYCWFSSSSSAKQAQSELQPDNQVENHNIFKFGVTMIPHPEKAYKGGEDAYYANDRILAVADGVGGWANHGVDPGLYSKELCENIKNLWLKNIHLYQQKPKKLIIDSAKLTKNMGSSTCCILTLDDNKPQINSSYIGDSGYIILRQNDQNKPELKQIFVFEEHQRAFNFPYQIGTNGDNPGMSLEFSNQVQDKDIVIVSTDGLFDNLSVQQITECVEQEIKLQKNKQLDMQIISKKIAELAFEYSIKSSYMSPFTKKGMQHGYLYIGGKSDDITVIAAQIYLKKQQKQQEQAQ